MSKALDVLLIEPNDYCRDVFQSLLRMDGSGGRFKCFRSLEKAAAELSNSGEIDLVFFSADIPPRDIARFISAQTPSAAARVRTFIRIVDSENSKHSFSHFEYKDCPILVKPFSLESFRELLDKVRQSRQHDHEDKLRAALTGILKSLIQEIDQIALRPSLSRDQNIISDCMHEACKIFTKLTGEHQRNFFELVCELFGQAAVPKQVRDLAEEEDEEVPVYELPEDELYHPHFPLSKAQERRQITKLALSLHVKNSMRKHRAALALVDIGTPEALTALQAYQPSA